MFLSKSFLERILAAKWHFRRVGDRVQESGGASAREGPVGRMKLNVCPPTVLTWNGVDSKLDQRAMVTPLRRRHFSVVVAVYDIDKIGAAEISSRRIII